MRRATRARRRFSVMAVWKTGVGFSLSPGLRGPRAHVGRRQIRRLPIASATPGRPPRIPDWDELEEGLVRRRTAERHIRGPGRGDKASVQILRHGSSPGRHDPRTDFTRITARISHEETADRAPGLCDQERGRYFFRQEVEQGASVRAEIRRVESGEAVEIVESERPDATGPPGRRGAGPTYDLELPLKS